MAVSTSFTRPLGTTTESVATSYAITTVESDGTDEFIIHLNATVNAATKTVKRMKLKLNVSGSSLSPTLTVLDFAGGATAYTGATTPADSAATATQTLSLTTIDLDAFYTAGGVART